MTWSDKKFHLAAAVIVAVLSAAMILEEYILSGGELQNDGYEYLTYAREILSGGWNSALEKMPNMANFPPLFVILIVAGGKCGLSTQLVGRFLNIACILIATQGILFCCLKLYKSKVTALMTALLVGSLPKIYLEGCGVIRDPLYWAGEMWIMYLMLDLTEKCTAEKKRSIFGDILLLTCLCGLSVLIRKEGVFLSFLVYAALAVVLYKSKMTKDLLTMSAVFAAGVAFIAFLPYLCGIPFVPLKFLI